MHTHTHTLFHNSMPFFNIAESLFPSRKQNLQKFCILSLATLSSAQVQFMS